MTFLVALVSPLLYALLFLAAARAAGLEPQAACYAGLLASLGHTAVLVLLGRLGARQPGRLRWKVLGGLWWFALPMAIAAAINLGGAREAYLWQLGGLSALVLVCLGCRTALRRLVDVPATAPWVPDRRA